MRPRLILLFLTAILLLTACQSSGGPVGTLEGHVTIGPLSPVAQEGVPEPTPNPIIYQDREIVIFKKDGKTEITRVQIDDSGDYRVELPVGSYVVDINHLGIDLVKDLPMQIEISEQEVTRLDIAIDTGIR